MNPELVEWLNLLARWVHVIAGIMWVGNSLLFNWLDRSLRPEDEGRDAVGHAWLLHSGGFYFVEKTHLRSTAMPPFVHWFKWQSYTTWITGFSLVILVYYMGGAAYLIDPTIWKLTQAQAIGLSLGLLIGGWIIYDVFYRIVGKSVLTPIIGGIAASGAIYGLCHLFSGRGAFLQAGAMIGSLMAGNVFFHIIPSQRELYSAIKAGKGSKLSLADRAKQRSIHNNYFTFPVLLAMISNHFGSIYGHRLNWLLLMILFATGALVRHFLNIRFNFKPWLASIGGTLGAATVAIFLIVGPVFQPKQTVAAAQGAADVTFAQAREIINRRCLACHSAYPTQPAFAAATGGVFYDTPEQIKLKVDRIKIRAGDQKTMPLSNLTEMTDAEREELGRWIDQGAKIP